MLESQESMTAKICSFTRAHHSNYARTHDKIFDDYLAFDMMGKDEYERVGQLIENQFDETKFNPGRCFKSGMICPFMEKYLSPIPLSRIAYAEAKLQSFVSQHRKCQYVICGAGMDTFSFRNDNPNIEIFELDHPDTQRYKLAKIKELEWQQRPNVHFVAIDFAKDDMVKLLQKAGFQRNVPTFFTILGVTYYLTLGVFEETVAKIAQLADNSQLVFDFPDHSTLTGAATERVQRLAQITEKLGEPMLHGYEPAELKEALNRQSFQIVEHLNPKDIQNNYFYDRKDGMYAYENIHFILAQKEADYYGRV